MSSPTWPVEPTPTPPPEPDRPERPVRPGEAFWGYQDLVILAGLALPSFILGVLITRALGLINPGNTEVPEAAGVLVAQFLAYGFWFGCLWALLRIRYRRSFWTSLGWLLPEKPLWYYAALGPVLAIAVGLLGGLLGKPDTEMPMLEMLKDPVALMLVGAFAITLGPLAEELIFRGFVLPLLARSLGAAVGVSLTAAFFALLHGEQYGWSWQHLIIIAAVGATFGVVRLRTGSTAAATVMHATYNLTLFAAILSNMEEFLTSW